MWIKSHDDNFLQKYPKSPCVHLQPIRRSDGAECLNLKILNCSQTHPSTDVYSRDGWISHPAIWIRPDFHYPVKSGSGQIARGTLDRIFCELQFPSFTTHDVSAQLTVHIAAKICPWSPFDVVGMCSEWCDHSRSCGSPARTHAGPADSDHAEV